MDKKKELSRLVIYLLLTFSMSWIIFILFAVSGGKFDGEKPYMESLVGLGMLIPFISHVLTRWITKEGFAVTGHDSMMLGISFKDKKWKYYVFAILIPWLYFELSSIIVACIYPNTISFENYKKMDVGLAIAILFPLIAIENGIIISFAALGEEGGWRGYMMPKLQKLVGMKKAILIGGVIWGIWHAPLTCVGHNFGTDYPGFPYLGIFLMCIFCIFIGIMLTFITIKTESIWPAAIMHAVNNSNPSCLKFFVDTTELGGTAQIINFCSLLLPVAVIGGICLIRMIKDLKKSENRSKN